MRAPMAQRRFGAGAPSRTSDRGTKLAVDARAPAAGPRGVEGSGEGLAGLKAREMPLDDQVLDHTLNHDRGRQPPAAPVVVVDPGEAYVVLGSRPGLVVDDDAVEPASGVFLLGLDMNGGHWVFRFENKGMG